MSRRRAAVKRVVLPDPKFGDVTCTKSMNSLMEHGKRSIAEGILYAAFETIQTKTKQDPPKVFHDALTAVKPAVEVRSRRVGGATYQVPTEVRPERSLALAMRWLIAAARKRGEKTMKDRISAEFLDAINGRGGAVKKREDTHRMAESNKAFSHYRW